ncbi:scavenger receptor class B member 1 [Penaeus vannamei]|uniref:scavenger receptor class B member 1 n=1 Tax=Penaeus vannamei TaxID=6689 RepID=UPI00387F6DE3
MASYTYDNEAYSGGGSRTGMDSGPKRIKKKLSCCEITLIILGSLSAVMGIVMVSGGYQAMFDAIMKSQMAVAEGSASYDMWRVPPMPLYLQVYFFNISNPDEFVKGAKPILQEVGPFCYREYHEKKEIVFHPNNTVTFFQQRWWIWDAEMSGNHTVDDIIVGLNTIPVVSDVLLSGESCRMGSPSYISFPHFLNADPYLLDTVEGLDPQEDKHAFVMDMIPELGTPMWVAARMQINMLVRPYPGNALGRGKIDILSEVPEVYMPLMWFEVAAGVPEEMVGQLQTLLFMMRSPTMTIIWSVMIAVGSLLVVGVLTRHFMKRRKTLV